MLLLDSDGQFPIENLPRLIAAVEAAQAEGAIGVRSKKDSLFSQFGTWSSGLLCNSFHMSSYRDFNSAFKLVYGPRLRSLNLEAIILGTPYLILIIPGTPYLILHGS